MRLTEFTTGPLPFVIAKKDASFLAQVGPRTLYPLGFSPARLLQIYWRAAAYRLVATGDGARGGLAQHLTLDATFSRNVSVGTDSYSPDDLVYPATLAPAALAAGRGVERLLPGSGTITASGSAGTGSSPAQMGLEMALFSPLIYARDPVIELNHLYYPLLAITCNALNTVSLNGGGSSSLSFVATTLPDPARTQNIGSLSIFGTSLALFCAPLTGGETRSIAGALTIASEFA